MSSFLFSCENATYAVPGEHAGLFSGQSELLSSAAGWEPGALNLAQACAMRFRTPLVDGETSRLLVDVEKPKEECWSVFSEGLDDAEKRRLVERYWQSYRTRLHRRIRGDLDRHGMVFHILIHSDSDQREHIRLETPKNSMLATDLARIWLESIRKNDLRCSHQEGSGGDDMSRELAEAYDPSCYAQVRLSVHQDFFLMGMPWRWDTIKKHLLDSLAMSAQRVEAAVHH